MQVESWMTRKICVVKPLDTIEHAREIMESHRVNQLPVVVNGHVVGIITDRDVRDAFPSVFDETPVGSHRAKETHSDPKQIKVEMVMTPHVLTLGPKATVTEAARLMRSERIGAVPIVDGERLVGIVTRSDLLDALVTLAESTAQAPVPL